MVKIRLLSIGRRMPSWIDNGVSEYARRLPRHLGFELLELPPGKKTDPAALRSEEAAVLLKAAGNSAAVIALDERGKTWTTEKLSQRLEHWLAGGRDLTLMIGGAEGLDASCRKRADDVWSLGPLTLPHMLVRVIVVEQLYRAWTILQGHPYHRPTVGK